VIIESCNAPYLIGVRQQSSTTMRHNLFVPIVVAFIIAIVGQAIILFGDFGPSRD
jgi:Na+/glutamate symporter